MFYSSFEFILAHSCSFLSIDVLELNLTAEKLQRRLRLIHGEEQLKEKIIFFQEERPLIKRELKN